MVGSFLAVWASTQKKKIMPWWNVDLKNRHVTSIDIMGKIFVQLNSEKKNSKSIIIALCKIANILFGLMSIMTLPRPFKGRSRSFALATQKVWDQG